MKAIFLNHLCGSDADLRFNLATPRDIFKQRTPKVDSGNSDEKSEEIRNYVHNTFELFEKIFDCLAYEESFTVQPIHKLRHPLIFYYGHTACFYINKLCVSGISTHINPRFEEMFAVGIDEMSWDDLNTAHYDWPTVAEVRDYRLKVRTHIDELMRSGKFKLTMPLTFSNSVADESNAFWWVILMGAEHERIHIETASVHVRELPINLVKPSTASFWVRCPHTGAEAPTNELIPISGGRVQFGRPPSSAVYGWDQDYSDGSNWVDVAPFKASKYLVSNAEFLTFMQANGYNTQRYWDEEGWSWVRWKGPTHPWFWVLDESRPGGYALRLQTELIDLPWDWPCELNNLEAHAFCNFKSEILGKKVRLLTEEEWTLLYDRYIQQDQAEWGEASAPGNVNLEHYQSSCPVSLFKHGDLYDVIGNVWQHCCTPVYPLKGYEVHPFYDDFSLPTFDGLHASMKGGTWVTTGNAATRDARFAFRRHFFQYIGVRYIEGDDVELSKYLSSPIGLDPEVDAITDTCYRDYFAGIPNGCLRVANFALDSFNKHAKVPPTRAMDLACGSGRVSFELTQTFPEVIGVDRSARRLIPGFAMCERGRCQYSVVNPNSGEQRRYEVEGDTYPWGSTRGRATFFQADFTELHTHLDNFSLIVCWNCLEQSYHPSAIPSHLLGRLQKGGILVIGGDYNWSHIKYSLSDEKGKSLDVQTADPLVNSVGDKQEKIFELLGGSAAVDRVGETVSIPVVFSQNDNMAEIRIVHLNAYLKK
ncbi:unnamed protein product [Phytomonas sp. EM1]|nr:unnamed protein product [Phytomonas sp. EM1]|eukprot:CCW59617.1 unnamed protein product [Phytomonas sp. isolate EM1]